MPTLKRVLWYLFKREVTRREKEVVIGLVLLYVLVWLSVGCNVLYGGACWLCPK